MRTICLRHLILKYGTAALADRINMNVTRGKNISETQNLGDTIEAVISGRKEFLNKISLGEKFDIRLYNYESGQYETKTVKIAGILNSPYYTLTGGSWFSGEDTVGLSDLVQRTNVSEGSKEILLFIKPFEGYDKFRYLPQQSDNHYLTVQNGISEVALENLKSDFLNIGYNVKSTKTAYDNSHKIGVQLVMTDVVTIIISLLTALVSSVGSIMLIIFKDKKMFNTYYRCGGTLKHNMYIIGINMALIILISAVISITGISIWNYKNIIETHELFGLTFDKWNILISVAFYLLTSVIIGVIAVAHFSKVYSGKENGI